MLGNVAVGAQSLQNYNLGNTGGQTEHTISAQEIPNHLHDNGTMKAREHKHYGVKNVIGDNANNLGGSDAVARQLSQGGNFQYALKGTSSTADIGLSSNPIEDGLNVNSSGQLDVIGKTGEEIYTTTSDSSEVETQQAISLMQPYVALNYIIKT